MPSTLATISIPHASGQVVAVTFDVTFTPGTEGAIFSASVETCDPEEIEDHLTKDGMYAWADMMYRCSPAVRDNLHEECRDLEANGHAS